MVRLFRWLSRVLTVLIVLILGGVALVYWFASRSLPDYSATFELARLDTPVEIVRDTANVPHILAETEEAVMFGLGFAHAQDRLWQMTLLRRTAQGRLSELFGPQTVRTDALLRRLDLYGAAMQSVQVLEPASVGALEAYAAGVNAWIGEVNEGALGRGAPEFFMFSNAIAPWQPADSVAIIKLMGLRLNAQIAAEVLRARLSLILPEERVSDIQPDVPGPGTVTLPDYAAMFPGLPRYARDAETPQGPFDPVAPIRLAGASNAWAAGPSRSAAGGTLLANDPHLQFTAPSIWYLARLELPTGGVIGGTIPGVPVVQIGRSARLGWAITSSYLDDSDLYVERLNPEAPGQVLTPDGWTEMTSRRSIIRVAGGDPVSLTLRWTPNGPVLASSDFDVGLVTPAGHVASVSWTVLSEEDTTLDAALALMRAGNVEEGLAASERFVAPSQNLVLVDSETIAMRTIGAIPRRSTRHQSKGRMPSQGWLPENVWQGHMESGANPIFVDPEGGILGNTNNKVIDRPFPLHLSYLWGDTQRIERWRRLMQGREVHTRESFMEAQLDTVSFTARSLLPLIARNLWYTGETTPEGTVDRRRKEALDLLAEWNGEMSEHLPEPLIFSAWLRALQDRLVRDELGPLAEEITHPEPLFIERVFRDIDGAAVWCDVIQSAPQESCQDIARLALDDALVWIDETWGGPLTGLRWGDAHEAAHDHPVLGEFPILRWLVNIRQSTSGGDNTLQRGATSGIGVNPFRNVHGPGYRGVYDFADPDSSVFIISTGQSGHPLSRHYDDLGELWRRGEYIPMSLDIDLARAGAVGVTHLLPES